jgi:molybdopterin converting factor subunit 1
MIVHVRLFARARDLAGADVLRIELPNGATIADLRRRLAADYPALSSLLECSALAVEDEFAAESLVLSAEGEIALLPPVSGGEPHLGTMGLIDETFTLKSGTKTPGVQWQYLGCVGKIAKWQQRLTQTGASRGC